MIRRGFFLSAIITVMSIFLFSGCPKKEVVKPEPSPAVTKEVAPPKPDETKIDEEALKARERASG